MTRWKLFFCCFFLHLNNCFCSCKKYVNCLVKIVKGHFLSLGKLFYLHANTVLKILCHHTDWPCRRLQAENSSLAGNNDWPQRAELHVTDVLWLCYLEVSLLPMNDRNTTPSFLAVTRKRWILCRVTLSLVLNSTVSLSTVLKRLWGRNGFSKSKTAKDKSVKSCCRN